MSPDRAFPGDSDINILLLGKDEDRDNRGRVVKTRGRTDTLIVAHVDFANNRLNMLSIPRDTLARMPGYRGKHKINAANAFGGPDLARQTVERLLGVELDGHILVDYELFEQIVDLTGGISVNVDKQLDYDDNWGNLHIHLKPGHQRLNGEQALGFVRFRKSNDGVADTDQERIARQQQFLTSAKIQALRPSNLVKLPELIRTVLAQSDTSLKLDQAMCLAYFSKKIGPEAIRMEVLPGTPTRTAIRVDTQKAKVLVNELFFEPEADSSDTQTDSRSSG